MLQRIVQRPITCADMPTNKELHDVQDLTNLGYVRDYGQQHGRRIPVNLRIWGITPAGRAALEQQHIVESKRGSQTQFGLTLAQKEILTIKPNTPLSRHSKPNRPAGPTPSEVLVERVLKEEQGE